MDSAAAAMKLVIGALGAAGKPEIGLSGPVL
jgi:hypothetical protein